MPASDSPGKERVAFYLAPRTIEDVKGLAERSGQTISEVYRQSVEIGVSYLLRLETDRITNERERLQLDQLKKL